MTESDYENFKDALEALDEFKGCIDRAGLNADFVEMPRATLSSIEHENQHRAPIPAPTKDGRRRYNGAHRDLAGDRI